LRTGGYKEGLKRAKIEVENFLISKYDDEKIDEILIKWKKKQWLGKRISILEQAIWAHKEHRFNLSVPAILFQIEGIIAEGYGHYGKMYGRQLERYACKLLSDTSISSFDEAIQHFFLNFILIDFEHGSPAQSSLSRHAILHGGDANYGTIENSLKCILLLDYILDKCGVISLVDDKTYHLIGCDVVNRRKIHNQESKIVVYKDPSSAESAGKKPCKKCKPMGKIA